MKNILVFAGGSGPAQLLEGLAIKSNAAAFSPFVKVQVLINALDNGLSTGQCRQIFGGKLLGPSDVRKNAISQMDTSKPANKGLYQYLNIRFNSPSTDAESYLISLTNKLEIPDEKKSLLLKAIEVFFQQPLAKTIDYHDFSIANLIYSGVAAQHGLSLTKASRKIAKELIEIPEDFVLLNSDESVFINAVTASGKILTDEVDIDEWDDITDRITDIFFTDITGQKIDPPLLNDEARIAIENADIIIFSSGTQWTSLIPTYATTGFKFAIEYSKAKKYLVMNNVADTDMTGLTSIDIVNVLKDWLPMKDVTTVLNVKAAADMRLRPDTPWILGVLGGVDNPKHDGHALVRMILQDYYKKELGAFGAGSAFLTDYDDTLVGRNGSFAAASNYNSEMLVHMSKLTNNNVAIVTGNSIRQIPHFYGGLQVFADNSTNEYFDVLTSDSYNFTSNSRYKLKGAVDNKFLFTQDEVDELTRLITQEVGIDISKICNKGYAGVGIKPIVAEYRNAIRKLIECMIDQSVYTVIACGRTTVDIYKKGNSKLNVINKFLDDGKTIVYAGDEWEKGNDAEVYQLSLTNSKVIFIKVNDPTDTALFFYTAKSTMSPVY